MQFRVLEDGMSMHCHEIYVFQVKGFHELLNDNNHILRIFVLF